MRLARRVTGIGESVTLEISAKAMKMAKEGIDVVGFAAGEPDFDTPAHIKEEAVKAIKEGFTKYTPSSGTLELREAIAKKFKKDNSLEYSASYFLLLSFCFLQCLRLRFISRLHSLSYTLSNSEMSTGESSGI